eukprot:14473613-Alexandrium_andersonii.AAC.1
MSTSATDRSAAWHINQHVARGRTRARLQAIARTAQAPEDPRELLLALRAEQLLSSTSRQ